MKKISNYISSNKFEFSLLVLLFIVSSFLRFYQIGKLNFFTYDQARDALYIKRIIVDHKLRLIGTQSSIPGLYTGPAYYYLMVPFLYVFGLSPVGIDFATALFGLLTVFLVYFTVKLITGDFRLGFLSAILYSSQWQVLDQSRFSWNPNPSPFFFVLLLFGLFKVLERKNGWWLAVFPSLGILLQLHYSGVCLIPVIFLFILLFKKKIIFGKWFYISLLSFPVIMSPLLFFDLRHNFTGTKAIIHYAKAGAGSKIPPPPFIQGSLEKLRYLLVELPFGEKNILFSSAIIFLVVLIFIANWVKNEKSRDVSIILLSTIILGILVASAYKGSFFSFYLTLMYPLGFLFIFFIAKFFFKNIQAKFLFIILIFFALINNIKQVLPALPRSDSSSDLKLVSSVIAKDIGDEKQFNLAAFSGKDRFDYNAVDFRYYLEAFYHKRSYDWDVLDYRNAKIMYLISKVGPIDPLKSTTWEILQFSPKKIADTILIDNGRIIVYKLIK